MPLLESISDKCAHRGPKPKGSLFEATDQHARALVGLGWAKYATRAMVAETAVEVAPAAPARTKRVYRRRDMQAQA